MTDENMSKAPSYVPNSVYRQDFRGEMVKRPDPIRHEPEYENALSGPYADPMLPDELISSGRQKPDDWEPSGDIYSRIIEKYPTLKKVYLKENVEQKYVISEYSGTGKSQYMVDYCKAGDEFQSNKAALRKSVELLEGWDPRPSTTQRESYKDLKNFMTREYRQPPFKPPPCHLGRTDEKQKILKVTTGKSEYGDAISDLGGEIIREAYFGEIKKLPHEYISSDA